MSVEKEQFEKVMGELRLAGVPAGAADVIQAFVDAQGAALSRVEAEAGRLAEAGLTAHVKATTLQTQLAEALGLLHEFAAAQEAKRQGVSNAQRAAGISRLVVVEERVVAFLARHVQAEQQEAHHENA